ncbi:MAG TPA: histidinol-phosphate transaminase [Dehalococcoidia bacterium]|nr:histidinol-phosphate transaminase [Dehalococcoidia bacterium]
MTNVQAHGGLRPAELAALGVAGAEIIDFSVNVSPIGPPAGVRDAIEAVDLAAYPDPDCTSLVADLAARLDVPADRVLVGNGSTELIQLLARVFVHRGQRPVALAPTFGEYAVATELAGGSLYPWQASALRGFRWNLKNKPDVLRRVSPPLVFVCNPNNPTGVYLGKDEVRTLAAALTGGPLLLDEAYVGFLDEPWNALDLVESGRVIVLRSLTKDYGLAGLRLGYLVAHPDVIGAVRRLQPAWSVNAPAQAAGRAALADDAYLPRMRAAVREGKEVLTTGLDELGLALHAGAANFVLVQVGDATKLRLALLRRGFAVRDCTSFGLPEYIRIGVRGTQDCRKLLAALPRALAELHEPTGGRLAVDSLT